MTYTELGMSRHGHPVLIDERGRVYRAEPIVRPIRDASGQWHMPADADADEYEKVFDGNEF